MPTITIDGRTIDVPPGTTIIEAAKKLGIFIPHYCYHPGLSIAGSCRMCLVNVAKVPKLQIACYTPVTDGMVVTTTDPETTVARQAILEFLLANHPLDCPVCDQAGECKLQEFYMQFGRYDSTLLDDKFKKHKAIPVGPQIILDSERCILCSRCTRFVDEVSQTHELGIFERGAHAELLPVEGVSVDNPYSGNLADICPVGALTDRDFRFKVRVWYLDETESVCHGCARNCSIEIHTNRRRTHHNNGKLIARYKPRFNPSVNGHWMCDSGRYSYKSIESEARMRHPEVSGQQVDWGAALSHLDELATDALDKEGTDSIAVIATPSLSNEELWAVRKLFIESLRITKIGYQCPPDPAGFGDNLLRCNDTFPNSFGADKIIGSTTSQADVNRLIELAESGSVQTLIVIGDGLIGRFDSDKLRDRLSTVKSLFALQTYRSAITDSATIALPANSYSECDGSICNFEGHIQRYCQAIPSVAESRSVIAILADWARRRECAAAPSDAESCFAELAGAVSYFSGLSYESLGENGTNPLRQRDAVVEVG